MALIEGVGDEVTVLCASLFLLSVIVLAWISTHTERRSSPGSSPGESSSARHGEEQNLGPLSAGAQLPGSIDDSHAASSSNIRTCPINPERSRTSEDPSPSNVTPSNDPSTSSDTPTVRHRPPTQDGPAESHPTITLRLKFMNETERAMTVRLTDSVLDIKRSQFPGQEPRVRLIYQGQLLRDDCQTVASLRLPDGCVLHCHLSQHTAAPGGPEPSQDSVNIGSLMVPLFLLLLGVLWYCQFEYPQVFNATATTCLGVLTLFVVVLVFSSYRR
ncbi:transmembrane and ubiquitin-like domain-containing protein 1 [Rhinoderma darwinii]|uniref:transmembrane and ubiquitin-like domain-containing protein 1 n=1 Tax=Rhinoderma darwinii TaxID=43563 RepID=UPI003F671AF5